MGPHSCWVLAHPENEIPWRQFRTIKGSEWDNKV
jgi:hypothetical protein